MFTGKHTEETKRKIAESRAKYTGENHPAYGSTWSKEQRDKYTQTVLLRRIQEENLKNFLILYNTEWEEFQKTQTKE